MKILACYKSHFSIGKSIITLGKVKGKIDYYPPSIFDLVLHSGEKSLCLVEDCMTGYIEAVEGCIANKLNLNFGLRLEFTNNIENQDEKSLKNRAKYVIFAKNNAGYKQLIKIWSFAANQGFYYNACIDFKNLKKFWNDSLTLAIPFYDSFLHLNSLEGHFHVPEFGDIKPTVFLEDNGLPFDDLLRAKAIDYAAKNGLETLEAQSIYYKSKEDFIAFATFRCIHERTTIEKPELSHFCSDGFCYDRWLERNK